MLPGEEINGRLGTLGMAGGVRDKTSGDTLSGGVGMQAGACNYAGIAQSGGYNKRNTMLIAADDFLTNDWS